MDESDPTANVLSKHEAASLVVRLARALDQARELLEAATELHLKVTELHAALAEPLVDLERLLAEAHAHTNATPGQPLSSRPGSSPLQDMARPPHNPSAEKIGKYGDG